MTTSIAWWQAALSLFLVAIAVCLSVWRGLGVERRVIRDRVRAGEIDHALVIAGLYLWELAGAGGTAEPQPAAR